MSDTCVTDVGSLIALHRHTQPLHCKSHIVSLKIRFHFVSDSFLSRHLKFSRTKHCSGFQYIIHLQNYMGLFGKTSIFPNYIDLVIFWNCCITQHNHLTLASSIISHLVQTGKHYQLLLKKGYIILFLGVKLWYSSFCELR